MTFEPAFTRGELSELRGGLEPASNGDGGGRHCAECGEALAADAAGRRLYCSPRCQSTAKHRRAAERGGVPSVTAAALIAETVGPMGPEPTNSPLVDLVAGLVDLVAGLVAHGLAVSVERDGWRVLAGAQQ